MKRTRRSFGNGRPESSLNSSPARSIGTTERLLRQIGRSRATLAASTVVLAFLIVSLTIRRAITGPILHVINGVTKSADVVASASSQIAESGQVVGREAHEPASCLEETASTLKEISTTTRQNGGARRPRRPPHVSGETDCSSGHDRHEQRDRIDERDFDFEP
jgi:hypothetical protein